MVIDVDDAIGLQLAEDAVGLLVLLSHPIVVRELLLLCGDELELGGDLLLPVGLGLLGLLDLLPGLASLAGRLQHVGADALVDLTMIIYQVKLKTFDFFLKI